MSQKLLQKRGTFCIKENLFLILNLQQCKTQQQHICTNPVDLLFDQLQVLWREVYLQRKGPWSMQKNQLGKKHLCLCCFTQSVGRVSLETVCHCWAVSSWCERCFGALFIYLDWDKVWLCFPSVMFQRDNGTAKQKKETNHKTNQTCKFAQSVIYFISDGLNCKLACCAQVGTRHPL